MSAKCKFLITGCPHQGTGWMSHAMIRLGHPTTYEWVYGLSENQDWGDQEGESSWLAGALVNKVTDPMPILHLTRHPTDAVAAVHASNLFRSECTCTDHEFDFHRSGLHAQYVLRFFPDIWDVTPDLVRAVAFVVMWNRIIETHGKGHFYRRFKIEDVSSDPDALIAATTFLTGRVPSRLSVEFVHEIQPSIDADGSLATLADIPAGYWKDQLMMLINDYEYGDADGY